MVDALSSALPVSAPEFAQFLFGPARPAAVGMDHVQLETRRLGLLSIPDGRVYACDPLVPVDSTPLAERLAPGQYAVVLFVLSGKQHGSLDTKLAYNVAAALLCSNAQPVQWELAIREGGPEDAAAYGVDSGTSGFMGTPAIEQLVDGGEAFGEAILSALQDTSGALVSFTAGVTAAAFHSGAGDGAYDTWLGRDVQGQPAIILTDFDVLKSEEYVSRVHAEWAARAVKKWWQFWR